MAVLTIEDPTGRIDVTLFPRVYAQVGSIIDKPDSVLVIAGSIDMRGGTLHMKGEAIKRASLSSMIAKAKEAGMFDINDSLSRQRGKNRQEEEVETLTEDGDILMERVVTEPDEAPSETVYGPVAEWIRSGMNPAVPASALGINLESEESSDTGKKDVLGSSLLTVSPYTITLPTRAPRELLLALKSIFETFPGSERVQLRIHDTIIPVPIAVTLSPLLLKRIDDAIARYSSGATP